MNMLTKAAWHESAHALIARDLKRPLAYVAVSEAGGITRASEPFAAERTPEELERVVVLLLAGRIGETYAPVAPISMSAAKHAADNGGEAAMLGLVATTGEQGPTDEEAIEQARAILGDEAIERARTLAIELVERMARTGRLELVADALILHRMLSADDLEALLAPPAA